MGLVCLKVTTAHIGPSGVLKVIVDMQRLVWRHVGNHSVLNINS